MKRLNCRGQVHLSLCFVVIGGLAIGGAVTPPKSIATKSLAKQGQAPRRSTDELVPARGRLGQDLFIAIGRGDAKEVDNLLKKGADPNSRNGLEILPLYIAAASHQDDVMKRLVEAGAKPDISTPYGNALMFAAVSGNATGFERLLSLGLDPVATRTDGTNPLMMATLAGSTEIVKACLAKKMNIDAQDNSGSTALFLAARSGKLKVGQLLLESGASVNMADDEGQTPLMAASLGGHADFVKLLLQHGADANARDNRGRTALFLNAAYVGSSDVASALIAGDARVGVLDSQGRTALDLAASRGFTATVTALGGTPTSTSESPSLEIHDAIHRSLTLLETSMRAFNHAANCVSCHHEALGRLATGEAEARGFKVDAKLDELQAARLKSVMAVLKPLNESAHGNPEAAKQLPLVEINETVPAYAWLLSGCALRHEPADAGKAAMATVLADQQGPDGSWTYGTPREPMESSLFTFTALSVQCLNAYAPKDQAEERNEHIRRAREWLLHTKAENGEDKASRLLGLRWAGADESDILDAVKQIQSDQNPDGSWSQVAGHPGDAYATGHALYALCVGGKISVTSPEYVRGVNFLLRTQDDDGSWFVNKRAVPANNHMDSSFPHGESQYASFIGTSWATLALLQSVPPPLR